MNSILRTCEIPFFSSTHGKERRTQRNIAKRDLQAAVKYGTRERGSPCQKTGQGRWKYTYADIVYVTDEWSQREITSWVLQLSLDPVRISPPMLNQYTEAKKRNEANSGGISSHTVFVVDKSASMRNSDVDGHRTRARGAYYSLAEEFIAKQLHPVASGHCVGGQHVRHTDVISLIEMRLEPTVVFELEPISWVLYNRIVELAACDDACSHGNYCESIQAATSLLEKYAHNDQALSLFFMTDGKPSDRATHGMHHCDIFPRNLHKIIGDFSSKFKERFTFEAFGLGTNSFEVLESMVSVAHLNGACAKFSNGGRDLLGLCDSMVSVMSSTTGITSQLSRLTSGGKHEVRKPTAVEREVYCSSSSFNDFDWSIFNPCVCDKRLKIVHAELQFNVDPMKWDWYWVPRPFQCPEAVGFAVKKKCFGEGAERIVFEMTEINAASQPVGAALVAKDSKYVIDNNRMRQPFHKVFIRTQSKAANLARKFNIKLNQQGVSPIVPRIHFLPSSVYDCNDSSSTYLVEKRLRVDRYKKWNDNAGGVDGVRLKPVKEPVFAMSTMGNKVGTRRPLGVLEEGDEDDEDDEVVKDDGGDYDVGVGTVTADDRVDRKSVV